MPSHQQLRFRPQQVAEAGRQFKGHKSPRNDGGDYNPTHNTLLQIMPKCLVEAAALLCSLPSWEHIRS